jgi:hypothetical protein
MGTKMTTNPVFASERLFETWRYSVSHRQLLLRSNKTNAANTRIEILFKNVSLMLIGPMFKGLTITICDTASLNNFGMRDFDLGGRVLYQLGTESFRGFVAAGDITVHEDELGYDDPSSLLKTFAL